MRVIRGDGKLIALVDAVMAEGARRAGAHLACRPGCFECCLGPFPITELDALRLRDGLRRLASKDPRRAAGVRRRTRDAVRKMSRRFPGDLRSGVLGNDDAAIEEFLADQGDLPCPVLDPSTGLCDLYDDRPITCRGFGPPVSIGRKKLPPCRLCFTRASKKTIEACRVSLGIAPLESPLVATAQARSGRKGETLIAFALYRSD